MNVIATGGSDGSCVPGKSTFVIRNSNNCGVVDRPAILTLNTTSVSGYDHLYTFAGALYQEGTQNDMLMTDSSGNTAIILFVLTYRFRDHSDPNDDYGPCCGPETQRVRVEVTLVPSAVSSGALRGASGGIHLGTVVVAGNSDTGAASYPYRSFNYSNTLRHGYGCNGGDFPSGVTASLCEGPQNSTNWISEGQSLPQTLAPGNFMTEQQSSVTGSVTDREMTYLLPPSSAYRLPERIDHIRIDHIWNAGLGVSSMDVDYFNNEDVYVPTGGSLSLGFDIQMQPHP